MAGHEVQQEAYGELSDLGRVRRAHPIRLPGGGVHPDLVRDHVRLRRGARLPGASQPRPGHHPGHAGRAGRLLRLVRGRPDRRPAAGDQARPLRAGDRVRREPGRALPRGPGDVGHPGGAHAAVRPRLHLDRRRPGARPGGQVRDPEPDRHGPLRGRALLDRLRARQHLAERQPRPRGRRLRAVRPHSPRHRRLHRLPLACGPARGPAQARGRGGRPGPAGRLRPGPARRPRPGSARRLRHPRRPRRPAPAALAPGPRAPTARSHPRPASQRPRSASS